MSDSEYNFTSKLLHRIALQSTAIAEISFDLENNFIKKKDISFSDNPVFISGLARSGTTILMRYLYETGQFKSLTYLDMPFVLMPNIWKKLSYKKPASKYKERAHKDGIMVGFDSPEAFEEVFWRVFCGKEYICKDRLKLQHLSNDVLEKFKDYIHNVLISSDTPGQRYLSKNNNNILRFEYLYKSFPDSRIIIPFRDPLQHAISLLSQHKHFSKVQAEDPFSLDYMNWLGHFEFGLNQKPFFLNNNEIFQKMESYDKMDINFWLLSWKNYYKYANEQHPKNSSFFCYEKFCSDPTDVLLKLFSNLGVSAPKIKDNAFIPAIKSVEGVEQDLLDECNAIYSDLEAKFNSWYQSV